MFGNLIAAARRVHFNPRMITKLSGIVRYFIYAVYTFHTMTNLDFVDMELSNDLGQLYTKSKPINANEKNDEEDLDLPSLKG